MKAQRLFRIFVSSTFGDFQAEREALRVRVWPALRDFCRARGASFQVVDLRWGVSASAELEHETMRICLDEIAHCQRLSPRPNFLVLVGDRYGWRPTPAAVPAEEFERILAYYGADAAAQDLLQAWYRRDDNAVPAEYVLQPRPAQYADWAAVESRLLALLRGAAQRLGMTPERRERYFLSATHLEVVRGALSATVPDTEQHVLAFFRTLEDLPAGKELQAAGKFVDVAPEGTRDPAALRYLNELKAELRQQLSAEPGHVFDYAARWTGVDPFITTDHLDPLCADVAIGLKHLIQKQLDRLGEIDRLEAERQAHEDFGEDRGRVFVGREEPLAALAAYLAATEEEPRAERADAAGDADAAAGEDNETGASGYPPLILHGPGGSGKSALMARAVQAAGETDPQAVLIPRFIGASPASVNLRALLSGLAQEIARRYGQPETLPEGEIKELIAAFAERLGYADAERPLYVFLDALDQLIGQEEGQPFEWLPPTLPPHVRLIVSVLDGPAGDAVRQRLPAARTLAVPPVADQEAAAMLEALLADATPTQPARRLTAAQQAVVLAAFQGVRQPLWLKLAVTLARRWRSYDQQLPELSVSGTLLRQLLTRLQGTHGPMLVERALAYVLASRYGLSDEELRDVLWRDADVRAEFDRRKHPDQPPVNALPPIVWSRLYFELEPYLIERAANGANCYAFFHRQMEEALRETFLGAAQALDRHAHLAAYFQDQGYRDAARRPRLRTLAELPWQQIRAGAGAQVEQTLTDFDFAMAKAEAGESEDLVEDYRRALAIMKPPSQTFRLWENFFHSRCHILDRADPYWPANKILLQLAVEQADESPVTQAAERWLDQGYCDWVWLRNPQRVTAAEIDPCTVLLEGEEVEAVEPLPDGRWLSWGEKLRLWDLTAERCLAVLEGHTGEIRGARVLADGRLLSWSEDKTLRLWDGNGTPRAILQGHTGGVGGATELADGRILSWSQDRALRLWDGVSGAPLAVLAGHTGEIKGAMGLADGQILSWSGDHILRLWDGVSGTPRAVLKGHADRVYGVAELTDGRILSWSRDHTLRLWDGVSGVPLAVLEGHTGGVKGTVVLADGRILSWAGDHTLRLWDGTYGISLAVLRGHTSRVGGAMVLVDGRILSWSRDDTLRLWDGVSGARRAVLKGHTDWVRGATILVDGRMLSWSYDKTLRFWDKASGAPLAALAGHTDSIKGVQVLADGRILSWSDDKTLRLWDRASGASRSVLEKHTGEVNGVAVLTDGRMLSWSDDKTLRLWGRASGMPKAVLEGHTDEIRGAMVLAGRILSWSWDRTLRLWDGVSGVTQAVLKGHTGGVKGATLLAGGRILSWSWDRTLRLWDGASGASLAVLAGHTDSITGVRVLTDGRVLSWSRDQTLRLWDGASGAPLAVLEGHIGWVNGAAVLADGRILSWSGDGTLRLWDGASGVLLVTLKGHTGWVANATVLADGRILSWSGDGTLRLWDGASGAPLAILAGHTESVKGATMLADRRILSWSEDGTLRLWDGITGHCLAVLEGIQDCSPPTGGFAAASGGYAASLLDVNQMRVIARWQGNAVVQQRGEPIEEGVLIVTLASGHVFCLQLYCGNRRIGLNEWAAGLNSADGTRSG